MSPDLAPSGSFKPTRNESGYRGEPIARADLLAIVNSWHDTMNDVDVPALMRRHNATGGTLHQPQ